MSNYNQVKQISFPTQLVELIERRVSRIGISVPEYIRNLVINDVRPILEEIPYVDTETERKMGKALESYQKGKYTRLNSRAEIATHFRKLEKEARDE